jgi:hypothetical protein
MGDSLALPDDSIQQLLLLLLGRFPPSFFKSTSESLGEAKAQLRRWAGTTFNQFLDINTIEDICLA